MSSDEAEIEVNAGGEEEEDEVTDLSNSDVCTKYQEAAKIVNLALQGLLAQIKPGAKVLDLCEFGHTVIQAQAQKLFTKKVNGQSIERGVAFPSPARRRKGECNTLTAAAAAATTTTTTAISKTQTNNKDTLSCVASYQVIHDGGPPARRVVKQHVKLEKKPTRVAASQGWKPMQEVSGFPWDDSSWRRVHVVYGAFVEALCCHGRRKDPLKAGDIVKIDLGCHIDGYIAVAAHTVIVSETPETEPKLEGEEVGNVAVATYNAMLVAAKAIAAGKKNTEVTAAVERVAAAYGVTPIGSARMHQMKRYVLDGVKEIALRAPTTEEIEKGEQLPECEFEQHEVYAVDIAMSTGDGNARPQALRTTVYKRNVEQQYQLKMKASRTTLAEVDKKFPTLPFTLRHLEDIPKARLGLNECQAHGLLQPYPCLHDHSGKVAHFKCTVLLLPSGTVKVTGLDLPAYFKTSKEPDEETAKVLKELEEEEAKKAARKAAKKKKKKGGK
eukprot:scaffold8690_cov190-Amphora_coffeaeformis.AAC.5